MMLPPPQIITVDGFTVIDDHEIGTKYRMALAMVSKSLKQDFFYATTESGDSPAALARACHQSGKRLTLFSTRLSQDRMTPTLNLAKHFGAALEVQNDIEYEHVYDYASKAAKAKNAEFIDFDNQHAIETLAEIASGLGLQPKEVWSASAKGAMARAYQLAWPDARHRAVAVMDYSGANFGSAEVFYTDTPYNQPFQNALPFPCNRNYEAKAWEFMMAHAEPSENVVFWNPAGPN